MKKFIRSISAASVEALAEMTEMSERGENKFLVDFKEEGPQKKARRLRIFALAVALAVGAMIIAGCTMVFVLDPPRSMGIIDKHPRIDSRLVFEDTFDYFNEDNWNIEKNIAGGGNNEFQYYNDDERNIWANNGLLNIKAGIFTQLPFLETIQGKFFTPEDVMTGNCEPFPECATFKVDDCNDPRFDGCEKIGGSPAGSILNPITSARVNTKDKFSFQYGRVEVSARLPAGDWLWPAIWLLPEDDGPYGEWPGSGEIDIIESRGNGVGYTIGGVPMGRNQAASTLHFGRVDSKWVDEEGKLLQFPVDGWPHVHNGTYTAAGEPDFTQAFRTFGLYWDEDAMYTYVIHPNGTEEMLLDLRHGFRNGFWETPLGYGPDWPGWSADQNPYAGRGPNAPFDRPFYLILNLAVGGNQDGYFQEMPWGQCEEGQEGCDVAANFWNAKETWYPSWLAAGDSSTFQIDSVRVWQ
eukprot:CAMPEP_0206385032 /NCGR_PEP_ID=MMETSP0294-20121207/14976_1 /ASSEMBLY_ACC=CAM_ASM_000327 /TAXON_ID=39354 /ORGANISM="Heterosigma akashiwo, Strain CCMP2393" /LENGTH=465 /DNA_ID=CAMNT_0053835551 /DNA_START=104 /DNA_END=1501 /DNA_ORIENTATION=-